MDDKSERFDDIMSSGMENRSSLPSGYHPSAPLNPTLYEWLYNKVPPQRSMTPDEETVKLVRESDKAAAAVSRAQLKLAVATKELHRATAVVDAIFHRLRELRARSRCRGGLASHPAAADTA